MIINIEDYEGQKCLHNQAPDAEINLNKSLSVRKEGRNSFWLRVEGAEFPSLNVAFCGEYATVNYCGLHDNNPDNWVSKSDIEDLLKGGETTFYFSNVYEPQSMDNSVVVSPAAALRATIEFFRNPSSKPSAVDWYEL